TRRGFEEGRGRADRGPMPCERAALRCRNRWPREARGLARRDPSPPTPATLRRSSRPSRIRARDRARDVFHAFGRRASHAQNTSIGIVAVGGSPRDADATGCHLEDVALVLGLRRWGGRGLRGWRRW